MDFGHQVEEEDDEDYQGADEPPCHLPVDIGLMSNHELQVLVEPEAERLCFNHLKTQIFQCPTIL